METTTEKVSVSVGVSIFRIGTDGFVYNNEQPLMPSHVGQVITTISLDTAEKVEAIYGGKWKAWGKGRFVIGADPDMTSYLYGYPAENFKRLKTPDTTGGEVGGFAPHTHEIPTLNTIGQGNQTGATYQTGTLFAENNTTLETASAAEYAFEEYPDTTANDGMLPPFITAYRWVRTA